MRAPTKARLSIISGVVGDRFVAVSTACERAAERRDGDEEEDDDDDGWRRLSASDGTHSRGRVWKARANVGRSGK